MPRFEADPSKVSSTIEILEKNDYEFVVGEPKAFYNAKTDGKDNYGVRYPITVAEGPKKGTRIFITLYWHTEGSQSMGKRFLMATLGYQINNAEEKRFDAETAGMDWSFDTDSGACGDMWRSLTGKHVMGSLDIGANNQTGEQQQQFKQWYPYGTTK